MAALFKDKLIQLQYIIRCLNFKIVIINIIFIMGNSSDKMILLGDKLAEK